MHDCFLLYVFYEVLLKTLNIRGQLSLGELHRYCQSCSVCVKQLVLLNLSCCWMFPRSGSNRIPDPWINVESANVPRAASAQSFSSSLKRLEKKKKLHKQLAGSCEHMLFLFRISTEENGTDCTDKDSPEFRKPLEVLKSAAMFLSHLGKVCTAVELFLCGSDQRNSSGQNHSNSHYSRSSCFNGTKWHKAAPRKLNAGEIIYLNHFMEMWREQSHFWGNVTNPLCGFGPL